MRRDPARQNDDVVERVSQICLALPEAVEDRSHPPHRAFKISNKNFVWYVDDEHGDNRIGLVVRVGHGHNEELVASDSTRFGLPKDVARHGWVTYYLDLEDRPIDWAEVTELVKDSFRLQAAKRISSEID